MRITTDRRSGVTLLALAGMWLLALALFCVWAFAAPADFTDAGVGCLDDCLDIQDEAATLISQERN